MKTTRKALSILLAVLMLASVMAVAAVPAQALIAIEFGTYPQKQVTETQTLKNAANAATWKSYGYYIGTGSIDGNMYSSNFMKFADFFSGGVKYRAVKFTQYRPENTRNTSSASNSFQDDNGYFLNTTYYFKYEPLTWRVLDSSTGLILCDSIIDAQAYQNLVWKENGEYYTWKDATQREKVYANNYASSSISNWLGTSFYDTAFSASQRENIKSTTINNAAYSSSFSQYDAPSTTPSIFLLSNSEIESSSYGLSSASARKARSTDYAKCQGLEVVDLGLCSYWRLRSAGNDSYRACFVNNAGGLGYTSDVGSTNFGIRPACKISNLTSDTSQSQGLYSAGTAELSLVASPAAGGSVSGGGVYSSNRYVDITATPTADYTFDCWKQGDTTISTSASYRYYFSGNAILTAYFTQKQRKVVVSADPSAGGTVSGGGTYGCGDYATVTAAANTGYNFSGWYKGSTKVSSSTSYQFKVPNDSTSNINLTAKFTLKNYTVTATAGGGGIASGSGTYGHGSSVTLTATPDNGYHFTGWYEGSNKVSSSASYTFTATKDVTLNAVFEKDTYTVTVKAGEGGTATGSGTYAYHAYAEITATPNSGYTFVGWFEDGEKKLYDASASYYVTKSTELVAKFEPTASFANVPFSTDNLKNGDWYFDLDQYTEYMKNLYIDLGETPADAERMAKENAAAVVSTETFMYNPQSGTILTNNKDDGSTSSYVRGEDSYDFIAGFFKQYSAPNQPDNPGGGNDQPTNTNPDNGGQSQGKVCKYCGEVHKGFPGVLIGFFHSILALFGLRKK